MMFSECSQGPKKSSMVAQQSNSMFLCWRTSEMIDWESHHWLFSREDCKEQLPCDKWRKGQKDVNQPLAEIRYSHIPAKWDSVHCTLSSWQINKIENWNFHFPIQGCLVFCYCLVITAWLNSGGWLVETLGTVATTITTKHILKV